MNNQFQKSILIIITLIFSSLHLNAMDVRGYIINENQDTTFGFIQLNKIDQITGALFINDFDRPSLHKGIKFKNNMQDKYKFYSPAKILGFGFTYNSIDFVYSRFTLNYNSIFKNESKKQEFLKLVYHGCMDLYQNTICLNNASSRSALNSYTSYYDNYMYSATNGLIKIRINEKIQKIRDLLRHFCIDEKYIQTIPEDTDLNQISSVLENYKSWNSLHIN